MVCHDWRLPDWQLVAWEKEKKSCGVLALEKGRKKDYLCKSHFSGTPESGTDSLIGRRPIPSIFHARFIWHA